MPELVKPKESVWRRLTRLFASGPPVLHKIASDETYNEPQGTARAYRKELSSLYAHGMAGYGNFERMARLSDYQEMVYYPIIASALEVVADEMISMDENGNMLRINSKNQTIKKALEHLFFETLNIEFSAWTWAYNYAKYGDFFLFVDATERNGILNLLPIPVNEIEREEGYDPKDPFAVRFRWITQGNKILENWQIIHFRILGNDQFLPYGMSYLESARRIWRQVIMIEDAMLVYRIVRAPERRAYFIDVGNIAPTEIEDFIEQVKNKLRRNQIVDPLTGRVDLRYSPLCHIATSFVYFCDGTKATFKEISDNFGKYKEKYVWSLSEEGKVVPSKILWAGKTLDDAKFIEVELDDGQLIHTTPEHKWVLRDGTEIQAKNLKSGDSLMPFYNRKNSTLSRRFGNYEKNYYVETYHPVINSWESQHKIVGEWKYGKYKFPEIIHHNDHFKFNNDPSNLIKMSQREHSLVHKENIKKLTEYSKSAAGRKKSSETIKKSREKYNNFKDFAKELWKNPEVRQNRVDALTLKIDSRLIFFVCLALNELGTECREYEVREWLNNNSDFISYLKNLNPEFKNGFNDQIVKMQFLRLLRTQNFDNLRAVKDFYVSLKAPWDSIKEYCAEFNPKTRREIFTKFQISKYDLNRLIELHNLTKDEFDKQYLDGGYYVAAKSLLYCLQCSLEIKKDKSVKKFCSHECYSKFIKGKNKEEIKSVLNHKIVAIRDYAGPEKEAYAITVEHPTHLFAVAGFNVDECHSNGVQNGVFIRNSTEEDIFVPIRDGNQTRIDTLAGGQNTGDIEDVNYLKDQLFAALKVPKAYLASEEDIGSKSVLSQQDVRFARTINRLQRMFVAELNKIAIIHLFLMGFEGEDLIDFELKLANPSTIAEQQKLELWRMKFEVVASATEGVLDRDTVYRDILNFSEEKIQEIKEGKKADRLEDLVLEAMQAPPEMTGQEVDDEGNPIMPEPGEDQEPQTLGAEPGQNAETQESYNKGSTGNDASIAVDKGKDLFAPDEDQFNLVFGTKKQTASDPFDKRASKRLITRPFSEASAAKEAIRRFNVSEKKTQELNELIKKGLNFLNNGKT